MSPSSYQYFDPVKVIPVIEAGIRAEKLYLEANKIIGNEIELLTVELRISEAELFLSFLRMDALQS